MQQSQLNQKEKEDPEKDNPALSKVIERNIRSYGLGYGYF